MIPYERDNGEPMREVTIWKGCSLGPTTALPDELIEDFLRLQDGVRHDSAPFAAGGVCGISAWDWVAGLAGFPLCMTCDHRRPPDGPCLVCEALATNGVVQIPGGGKWSEWFGIVKSKPEPIVPSMLDGYESPRLNRKQRRAERARARRAT